VEAAGLSADPEIAFMILEDGEDGGGGEGVSEGKAVELA
jgi:hypothetical protein